MATNTNSTQQTTQSDAFLQCCFVIMKAQAKDKKADALTRVVVHSLLSFNILAIPQRERTLSSQNIQPIVDRVLSDPSVSRSGSATLPSGESVTYTYVPMTGGAYGSGGNKQGGG
ncbi:hypothetical protein L198_04619 [Cryptococcus wingfieldii CBS 7118]|uniref:Uncharacterized protein n=1 Tax=Cryptococcus wingfieldii CBS 7118 TaxID=1295528 RepID=A0A1E3J5K9_9TREE|nr:hypothetical protein L198_04619 [Cryptococcus wingfieldii CBS 7118]ODN95231.1 hypothetical protein L198_04619 [Cryptococcus wingfieldii CBS 7118]